jgi:uncharacterized OsmC-like protein
VLGRHGHGARRGRPAVFDLETDATAEEVDRLLHTTERYCVVLQTLTGGVPVEMTRS